LSNSDTSYKDQKLWDFGQDPTFSVNDVLYQDITEKSETWANTFLEQFFRDRPVRYDSTFTNGGRAAVIYSLKLNQAERTALIEIAMLTNQLATEEETEDAASDEDIPSSNRRKAFFSNSANHSPLESYRKGHNAI
jgi:hypothetical protein